MWKISQKYSQSSSIVENPISGFLGSDSPLSGFLGSLAHDSLESLPNYSLGSFEIRFNKKMNLSLDKISRAYQRKRFSYVQIDVITNSVFTPHPTKRNLPKYLRETQIVSQQKQVKFIKPPSCSGDGFVSFIKSSRKGSFRRDEIRKYYMEILEEQYQDSFHLFFLLGSPSSTGKATDTNLHRIPNNSIYDNIW